MFASRVTILIQRWLTTGLLTLALVVAATACREQQAPPDSDQLIPTLAVTADAPTPPVIAPDNSPTPEPTPVPPTPTPLPPLAALVNDQPIFLSDYERELARYEQAQAALGGDLSDGGHRQLVLDALIGQTLIEQAAVEYGIFVSDELVEDKIEELRAAGNGAQNLDAWLQANQYSMEEFRRALAAEMIAERVAEYVTRDAPQAVEQVRARYIQVDDGALAASLREQIEAGGDFALLAQLHSLDRVTGSNGGDLGGYFARGMLLVPEVEEAAFSLEVGATSEVIAVTNSAGQTTYYLVQLIERDAARPLDGPARHNLLTSIFESWLADRWSAAEITRFIDTP
jgi:parvulin-like peptidyl-prolyl isomerase